MPTALGQVEFGGPDLPPRRLRDLLQTHVDGSPPGSRIDWATYYFRDRALAQSLIRASDRGVQVQLAIEPRPRLAGANDAVLAMLRDHGLNGGFHPYQPAPDDEGHLHAKIYAFSHPDIAWIGSFNPSGDEPDDPAVIAEIGDQDRGHNLLLGITDRKLTSALRRHVGRLSSHGRIPLRLRPAFNVRVRSQGTSLYFYPRLSTYPVERSVARLRQGDRLRGAISHLKKGELATQLIEAVGRGARVQLLVHDTDRRVPTNLVERLAGSGIDIVRVAGPSELPMHAKFLLIERGKNREAWLGSYNFNKRSRLHNAEILLRTKDSSVFTSLEQRFEVIAAMA